MPVPERYTSEEFEELCNAHIKCITALGDRAARNVGALDEDLPDAVQDALLALHRTVVSGQLEKHDYDTLGNDIFIVWNSRKVFFPRSIFKTIVERLIFDRHRARKRRQQSIGHPDSLEPEKLSFIEVIDTGDLTEAELSARLDRLCPLCKKLIKLYFSDNLTFQQICDELTPQFKNEAAVRRKLRDCLDQLRKFGK